MISEFKKPFVKPTILKNICVILDRRIIWNDLEIIYLVWPFERCRHHEYDGHDHNYATKEQYGPTDNLCRLHPFIVVVGFDCVLRDGGCLKFDIAHLALPHDV